MVGLTLALLLSRTEQFDITLVEAVPLPPLNPDEPLPYRPSFDARNTALSRRTVSAYQELGLWDELQQHATPIHHIHISEQNSFGIARLHAAEEGIESFGQVIENAWLGLVLLRAVKSRANITVLDGAKLTALQTTADTAIATIIQKEQTLTLEAPLVIAADGADSICRQLLGVDASIHDYQQTALVTTVATHLPHQQTAYERFTADGPLALMPLPDDRRAIVWTLPKGQEQMLIDCSDAEFLAALQKAFGNRAGKFIKTGKRFAYPLRQILAQSQALPRVAILGNAAHTLHPVAGQGFNLCLRDCLVLTERLVQQQRQQADIGDFHFLKAYEQARLTDQQRVIRFCDGVVRGFSNRQPVLRLARNLGLLAFDIVPNAKQTVANYAMGLRV